MGVRSLNKVLENRFADKYVERVFNLYSANKSKFDNNEALMESAAHICINPNLSYQRRMDKLKEAVSGVPLAEAERKYLRRLAQHAYENHLDTYSSHPRGLRHNLDILYKDHRNDFSSDNKLILEKITQIASNRGYSHSSRVSKIDSLLYSHVSSFNDDEREFVRKLIDEQYHHVNKSRGKIKEAVEIEKRLLNIRKDFQYSPEYVPEPKEQNDAPILRTEEIPSRPSAENILEESPMIFQAPKFSVTSDYRNYIHPAINTRERKKKSRLGRALRAALGIAILSAGIIIGSRYISDQSSENSEKPSYPTTYNLEEKVDLQI